MRHIFLLFLVIGIFLIGLNTEESFGSFGTPIKLSINTGDSDTPSIAASGNLVHVVWEDNSPGVINPDATNDIFYARSTNGGQTFETLKSLLNTADHSHDPIVAAEGNFVYVAWEERDENFVTTPGAIGGILFKRSTDNGQTFDSHITLSPNTTCCQDEIRVVSSGSNVIVVWTIGNDLYVTKSTNNGQSFSSPINLSTSVPDFPSSVDNPVVVFSGNNLYIAVNANGVVDPSFNPEGDEEVLLFVSNNFGQSFNSPVNVSDDFGDMKFRDDFDIAVSGNNVYVTWSVDITTSVNVLKFSSSNNNGVSFNAPIEISNEDNSDTPRLVVMGNDLHVFWDKADNSLAHIRSFNFGASFTSEKTITPSNTSDDPSYGAAGNNLYLVYYKSSDAFFVFSKDRGATFSTPQQLNINSIRLGTTDARASTVSVGDKIHVVWEDPEPSDGDIVYNFAKIDPALISVNLNIINDNEESGTVDNFILRLDGNEVTVGDVHGVQTGTHIVSVESDLAEDYGVSFSGACSGFGTFTVKTGQNAVCTITVDDHSTIEPFVEISGRSALRFFQPSNYTITIGNSGNTDIFDGILLLKLSNSTDFSLFGVDTPNVAGINYAAAPIGTEFDNEIVIPIWIYNLTSSSSKSFQLSVKGPPDPGQFNISAEFWQPSSQNSFVQTGNTNFVSSSSAFSTLVNNYIDSKADVPTLFNKGKNFYAINLDSWLVTNLPGLQIVPFCHLSLAATTELLNVANPGTIDDILCEHSAEAIDAYLNNPG